MESVYVSGYSSDVIGRPRYCNGKREGNTITAYYRPQDSFAVQRSDEKVKVTETEVQRGSERISDYISCAFKLSNGAQIHVSSDFRGVYIYEEWHDTTNPLTLSGPLPNKSGSWIINGENSYLTLTEIAFAKDCSKTELIQNEELSYEESLEFVSGQVSPVEQRTINELKAIYNMLPEDNKARDDMKVIIERAEIISTSGWGNNFWRSLVGW